MDKGFKSKRYRPRITGIGGGGGGGLVSEASHARRVRRAIAAAADDGSTRSEIGAADSLERQLAGRLPETLDLCPYLTRVATLMQMSGSSVAGPMTSIAPLRVPSSRARLLAIALNEFVHFLIGCARPDCSMDLCLAVVVEGDRLVVGLAAMGEMEPVPARNAMAALLRGARLVECAGGCVSRGVELERIVIGVTFDDAALLGAITAGGSRGQTDDG